METREFIGVIMALAIPLSVIAVVYHRAKTDKGLGLPALRFLALGLVNTELDLASPVASPRALSRSSWNFLTSCAQSRLGQEQTRTSITSRPYTLALESSRVKMT